MCNDLLPENFSKILKKNKNDMSRTPLPQILQKATLVSQLLLSNAKIFESYIHIATCELFRI